MSERIFFDQGFLTTQVFGRNLIVLGCTGSTNDVAKGKAAQGAPEGMVVLADEQTAGRGRLGRRWVAPPGTCLLCSILFRPNLPPTQAQRLAMVCALAAADAVEDVAGLRVGLKWPNDLIVEIKPPSSNSRPQIMDHKPQISSRKSHGWRKLAGVLTESGVIGERLEFIVVGIGINVNVLPGDLVGLAPDATSIRAETGQEVDRARLLAVLLAGVEVRYESLQAGESPRAEWAARLATLGQTVQVATPDGVIVGVAEAVDEDGALLLHTDDGAMHRFVVGDVTLVR